MAESATGKFRVAFVKNRIRAAVRNEVGFLKWRQVKDDEEVASLIDSAAEMFVNGVSAEIDWATFFQELLKFLKGLLPLILEIINSMPTTP